MLGRVLVGALTSLAVAGGAAVPAAAEWTRTTLPPEVYWAHDVASARVAESLLLHRTIEGTFSTVYPLVGEPRDRQQLGTGWNFYPTIDASAAGGAVAAWYDESAGRIRIAERSTAGGAFAVVESLPGGASDYSYGHPLVQVNERGDALVVYLAAVSGAQEVRVAYRPAGDSFREPEALTPPAPWSTIIPRDVALAPDGTAVVGFVHAGMAHVARRPPGGPFEPAQPLGGLAHEHSWQSPRVGVDAAGDVVAAWVEEGSAETGPVRIAFRRRDAATFGAPRDLGVRATVSDRLDLGVSAQGEVVLIVEASTDNPNGGTRLQGLHAAMGNAPFQRMGPVQPLTDIWGDYPSFAMNARGDAVIAYGECCPMAVRAQRRKPLGGFGPVEDLQPPIDFEGWRSGIIVRTADVDEFGNSRVTYEDGEVDRTYLAVSSPFVDVDPGAPPPLGDLIAPVLAGGQPPELPPTDPPTDPPPGPIVPESGSPPEAPLVTAPTPKPAPAPGLRMPLGTSPASADRTGPRVTLTVARRLSGLRRPRLVATVRCSEACSVSAAGRFAGRRIGPAAGHRRTAGTLRLRVPVGRLPRSAARASAVRVAALVVTATDSAGNATTRQLRARVRTR